MKTLNNIFSIKNNISMVNRNLKLDFIRGLAMILVLLHHCNFMFGKIILLFHMPLFFILSGYTTYSIGGKIHNQKFITFFKKKFKKLIIPYFLFEIIQAIVYVIYNILCGTFSSISFESIFISILTCVNMEKYTLYGRLWFLPCIFISYLIIYFVLKLFSNNKTRLFPLIFLFFLSYITSKILCIRLPFTIDISLMSSAFMLIGYMFGNVIKKNIESNNTINDLFLIMFFLIVFIVCIKFFNPKMLMYVNQYGNFIFSILCALAGSFVFIIICKYLYKLIIKINFLCNWIIWYSQNSLASFPVHLQILSVLLFFNNAFFSHFIILFSTTFFLNIVIVNIINNYFPFMIQKNK